MEIQKAFEQAKYQNTLCIRRAVGIMQVRFIQPSETYGFLMMETYGPLSPQSQIQPNYIITPEDLDAKNWEVSIDRQLQYIPGQDDQQEKYSIDDAIESLCGHIIEDDLNNESIVALTTGVKTLCEAKSHDKLNDMRKSIKKVMTAIAEEAAQETGKGSEDDSKQTAEQ